MMPATPGEAYPDRDAVLAYMAAYEARYALPVERPVEILSVRRDADVFLVETDRGVRRSRALVAATGTWRKSYVPDYPDRERFQGLQIHSAAQILAEVSLVADVTWVTPQEPMFLPDEVDGRVLF